MFSHLIFLSQAIERYEQALDLNASKEALSNCCLAYYLLASLSPPPPPSPPPSSNTMRVGVRKGWRGGGGERGGVGGGRRVQEKFFFFDDGAEEVQRAGAFMEFCLGGRGGGEVGGGGGKGGEGGGRGVSMCLYGMFLERMRRFEEAERYFVRGVEEMGERFCLVQYMNFLDR